MQVQQINNNNTSFGNINGVRYKGKFRKDIPSKFLMLDEVLQSNHFTAFGKIYNYIVGFCHTSSKNSHSYQLWLYPDNNNRETNPSWVELLHNSLNKNKNQKILVQSQQKQQLPNLPIDILVCCECEDTNINAFNNFIKRLRSITLDDLSSMLQNKINTQKDTSELNQE